MSLFVYGMIIHMQNQKISTEKIGKKVNFTRLQDLRSIQKLIEIIALNYVFCKCQEEAEMRI